MMRQWRTPRNPGRPWSVAAAPRQQAHGRV